VSEQETVSQALPRLAQQLGGTYEEMYYESTKISGDELVCSIVPPGAKVLLA
jgi:hypothetical protein